MKRRARAVPLVFALLLSLVWGVGGPAVAADGVPPGSISGRLTVPEGIDATRVYIRAFRADLSGDARWAYAAADGSYAVEGLPPGSYYVEFTGWDVGLIHEYWNDTRSEGLDAVVVGSGPVTGIDATLALGAAVSGTIRTTSDCDLTGVRVRLWFGAPGVYPDAVVTPDGRWSLRGLPAGSYGIEFDGSWVGLPKAFWSGGGFGSRDGIAVLPLAAGQARTGIDVTLNGPQGCLGLRPYVATVYRDLLRRYPDGPGLNDWVDRLAWGASFASVANGITASDEFRSRLIGETYQRYLGRGAEPAGLANWLGAMRAGWQIEEIQAGFVASDEFYARYGSTAVGWVAGLYQTVLGRGASSLEIQGWVSELVRGASRRDVARGFLYSTEHLTAVVDGYYVDLLGRHIDPTGQATWVGLIQRGHRDEEIIAGIVASQEYRGNVPPDPWPPR